MKKIKDANQKSSKVDVGMSEACISIVQLARAFIDILRQNRRSNKIERKNE